MIYYFVRKFVTYVRYLGTKQGCYKVCFLVLHNNGFYMDAEVNWLRQLQFFLVRLEMHISVLNFLVLGSL